MENGIMVASAAAEGHGTSDMIINFGNFGILGDVGITNQMITMWGITLIIIVLSIIASKQLKKNPGKFQVFVEWAVGSLNNFFGGMLGPERGPKFMPLLGTYFIFILLCNYVGLLPFAGSAPGLKPPGTSLSFTVGLSLIAFFVYIGAGIKYRGKAYFKHFLTPFVLMLPLNILEEVVRPVSLSLRLYGNVFGEETVIHTLYGLCPFGVPLVMMFLSVLFCLIQALVFTLLTTVYIDLSTSEH